MKTHFIFAQNFRENNVDFKLARNVFLIFILPHLTCKIAETNNILAQHFRENNNN
jgi:hypothetical protein